MLKRLTYFSLLLWFTVTELVTAQYDRSYHLNSNNFADQLTKNYRDPFNRAEKPTEEERNRLNALSGIRRIDDGIPHPSQSRENTYLLTSPLVENSGDLSGLSRSQNRVPMPSIGQDLTGIFTVRGDPFADRNRLFQQEQKFPANVHYERPADDMNDFSYLYRSATPPPSQFQKQLQSMNYEQQLKTISNLVNHGTQQVENVRQNVIEFGKSTVEASHPVIESTISTVKDGVQKNYQPAVQNVVDSAKDKLQEFSQNVERTGQPAADNALAAVRDRFQQFQNAGTYSQQTVQLLQQNYESAKPSAGEFIGRATERFDTNIPRYAGQPLDASRTNRIDLNPTGINNAHRSVDDYMKSNPRTQSITVDSSSRRESVAHSYRPTKVDGGNSQTTRTRILTKGFATPITLPESTEQDLARADNNLDTATPSTNNFTTYPNLKLNNQVKEDPRPATGRRQGPQGRFGGGTNEYREDLGKTWEINDRRPPWMKYPGMGGKPDSVDRTMPLNQFSDRVSIENYPSTNSAVSNGETVRRPVGDDLSNYRGHNQFGHNYLEYTTSTPHGGQPATIIAVPMKYGEPDRTLNGPASRFIDLGISPSSQRIALFAQPKSSINVAAGQSAPVSGQIRQYYGPEEITGSRYRNIDEHFHELNGGDLSRRAAHYVKIDLLNK